MIHTNQIQEFNYNEIKGTLGLTTEQIDQLDDTALSHYWFAIVHNLTGLVLDNEQIHALIDAGFFNSMAMMRSMQHLTMNDVNLLVEERTVIGLIIRKLYSLPECRSEICTQDYSMMTANWISLQFGIYSLRLPFYLWWMVIPEVSRIIDGKDLYFNLYSVGGVPSISLGFGKFMLSEPHNILEFEMQNTADPVLQCVDDFLSLGIIPGIFSYENKVIILYQLIQLYDLDPTWRYAFVSPIRDRLVSAYEPGDTFLDSLWKCLNADVDWVTKPSQHLRSSTVMIGDKKVDLVIYALNPTVFVERLKE